MSLSLVLVAVIAFGRYRYPETDDDVLLEEESLRMDTEDAQQTRSGTEPGGCV